MPWRDWLTLPLGPQTLGRQGERAAERYLRRQGLRIVETRRRLRYGEIDVIAVEGRTLVFVEVKTRRGESHGRPADAVDQHRRERMTRAALSYLKAHGLLDYPARFDVVEIVWPVEQRRPSTIRWHRNAFSAEGRGQFFR